MSGSNRAGSARERARRAEQEARRRRDRRILILVAVAVVVLLVGGGVGLQAWRTSRSPDAGPAPAAAGLVPVAVTDGQPLVFGRADAPARIRLYEDFHCPHCADFEEEFGATLAAARDQGRARIEVYPMAFIDQGSFSASNAMACAAEAGFGPAYYSGLFANHTLGWSDGQLIDLAEQVTGGSVPDGFAGCVQNRTHAGWVESINAAANAAGVSSTPTLFLGDQPVDLSTLTPESLDRLIAAQQ